MSSLTKNAYQLVFIIGGTRLNAVPTNKNYTFDSLMRASAGFSSHRSAMMEPRPGGTAIVTTVTSRPSKFISVGDYAIPSCSCITTYFIDYNN